MKEYLLPEPVTHTLPPAQWTVVSGREILEDPDLARLRRYLPALVVIAAPFVGMGGSEDPLNPLDPVAEWGGLVQAATAASGVQQGQGAPLALVRVVPPTSAWLSAALGTEGPDAFRLVHLVCHGERDLLYLEDEDGHEAYAVAEHVVSLFKPSGARVVVLEGCFSRRLAQMLIDDTPVQAVVGTRRRVAQANALTFNTRFYAELALGQPVRDAYRSALADLKNHPNGQADRYDFVFDEEARDIVLMLPAGAERASRPLIADGMPRVEGLPLPLGFTGRRELLAKLAGTLSGSSSGVALLHGPGGIGKTWLAADYAVRFGWRFADGVVWLACADVTTAREIVGRLARLLGLAPHTPPGEVLAALRERRILLVLDGADWIAPDARQSVIDLVESVAAAGGSWVLLTARDSAFSLPESPPGQRLEVGPLLPKDARALALRLAIESQLDTLDVDTIDDFLDRTRSHPGLIAEGVRLIEARGIAAALDDLRAYVDGAEADLQALHVRRQLRELALREDRALSLLARAHALPAAFEEAVARGLAGQGADDQIATLLRHGLLRHEGALYRVPADARALVAEQLPLTPAQQAQIDRLLMQYLARTWPPAEPERLPALTARLVARLANARALLQRGLKPGGTIDPDAAAGLALAAVDTMRGVGLLDEFMGWAEGVRARLSEGAPLGRLQVAMGEVLSVLPTQRDQAGWLFQVTLALDLDAATRAEASRAYAGHLLSVGERAQALALLAQAVKDLVARATRADATTAARLARAWAQALAGEGRWQDAVPRFRAALAGYSEAHDAVRAALAERDLGLALWQLGDSRQAAEALRGALTKAEALGRSDVACGARCALADIYQASAEPGAAARAAEILHQAVADALATGETARMAEALHRLARSQARGRCFESAAATLTRSRVRYERGGDVARLADVLVTLGQLRMAQGDSVTALDALHKAIEHARAAGATETVQHAAGVLLRVHQIRARYAAGAGERFRAETLRQAQQGKTQFAQLGLSEHAAALDQVITALGAP